MLLTPARFLRAPPHSVSSPCRTSSPRSATGIWNHAKQTRVRVNIRWSPPEAPAQGPPSAQDTVLISIFSLKLWFKSPFLPASGLKYSLISSSGYIQLSWIMDINIVKRQINMKQMKKGQFKGLIKHILALKHLFSDMSAIQQSSLSAPQNVWFAVARHFSWEAESTKKKDKARWLLWRRAWWQTEFTVRGDAFLCSWIFALIGQLTHVLCNKKTDLTSLLLSITGWLCGVATRGR